MDFYLWIIAIGTLLYFLYKWSTKNYSYFEKKGIKYYKPLPLIGNMGSILVNKKPLGDFLLEQRNYFKDEKVTGSFAFLTPIYSVHDPELIRQIGIKDFDHFVDHKSFVELNPHELFSKVLTVLTGQKWKDMRSTLSPAFTSSKMKLMFELVNECGQFTSEYYSMEAEKHDKLILDMKKMFSRYTNDVIASCAFGIKINSLTDENNEFFIMAERVLRNPNVLLGAIKFLIIKIAPNVAPKFGISISDKKMEDFFRNLVMEAIHFREEKNIVRPDMINLLMLARKGKLKNDEKSLDDSMLNEKEDTEMLKWQDEELIAQCFLFFLAGFETVSMALSFAAYELAANPSVQQKLIDEIDSIRQKTNNQFNYQEMQSMKYLDAVCSEVLRKWPPALATDRLCVKDYSLKINDEKHILIEKDMQVVFPIYALHFDEKYFPNPNEFNPERFNDDNIDKIVPGSYIPFGIGPRNCIASRFAIMKMKIILFNLLSNFTFEICDKTMVPMKFGRFLQLPDGGIHTELRKRTKI